MVQIGIRELDCARILHARVIELGAKYLVVFFERQRKCEQILKIFKTKI
jgi:hypothetical protein